MKKLLCFLLILVFCLFPINVFAEEIGNNTETIETVETVETVEETEIVDESVVEEENADNTDSQYDLLLSKIDVLISLIYCWFLWSFFCAIYKVLYRLFCFVI